MPEVSTAPGRQAVERVVAVLRELWGQAIGVGASEIDIHTPFLELGADSLCLLQVSQALRTKFNVTIPFRLMLDEVSTVNDLALYVLEQMPDGQLPEAEATREATPEAPQPETPAASLAQPGAEPATFEAPSASASPEPAHAAFTTAAPVQEAPPAHAAPREAQRPASFDAPARPPAGSGIEQLLAQQLQIISQQLDVLRHRQTGAGVATHAATSQPAQTHAPASAPTQTTAAAPVAARAANTPALTSADSNGSPAQQQTPPQQQTPAPQTSAQTPARKIEPDTFVPYRSLKSGLAGDLTPRQRQHLDALVERVTRRTPGSKRDTQEHRRHLADSRTVAGFRLLWKEMHYPLVVERAEGSRIWDVDGNEYVDITMGFGALLYGHSPEFIMDALREQTALGLQIGARSSYTGKAARLFCELTGMERVQFCNSGTEAVMTALRLARVATGRAKIALFEGGYHGTFDGVMVRGQREAAGARPRAVPMAPGIPHHMIDNVVLLDMNDPRCLEDLRAQSSELAAIMIEPRQSRRPDLDLGDFLRELRRIADASGAVLIFDEVVTGFRFHPGGARALFGVEADLVTFGKAMAGGLPVAALGGKAAYMDAVDGGHWQYGDGSFPQAETTFVAGTYFMHPLLMPVVYSVLRNIEESGPELREQMRRHVARLASTLNAHFERERYPLRVAHFESLFRFFFAREVKYPDLFYFHLLEKGVFVCETRGCILSTAHTDEDIDHIIRAVTETVAEMREGGFLPEYEPDAPTDGDRQKTRAEVSERRGDEARSLPLTEAQKAIWALSRLGDDASRAYHQSFSVRIGGPFDAASMGRAMQRVVERHEALRVTFSPDGERQLVHPRVRVDVPLVDFSGLDADDREARVAGWLADEVGRPFDLARGPVLRAAIVRLAEESHLLVITIHHIVTDGWSNSVVQNELAAIYAAECRGQNVSLPEPMQFSEYVARQAPDVSAEVAAAERYWLGRFADAVPVLDLPPDRQRPAQKTFDSARDSFPVDAALYGELKQLSTRRGATMLMTLLAAYNVLLRRISGQEDFIVGLHLAGQLSEGAQSLVGHCVNLLPLRTRVEGEATFADYLADVKREVLEAHRHQNYPLNRLMRKLNLPRDPSRLPLITVTFNLDVAATFDAGEGGGGASSPASAAPLEVDVALNPPGFVQWDMSLNVIDSGTRAVAEFDYNTSLFEAQTVRRWMDAYAALLGAIVARPEATVAELERALDEAERERLTRRKSELKQNFKNIKRKAVRV
ncbi:MAG TPA: aminotransferase class III-fold pyridoxal phosphate-dependent enzyme [Pyrinomonadaceae bacterium]|nr:aminotransferase class III-fold pyridoxal phosphate-dependent enzyme [Pyrinomonadaceae bacterium]